MCKGNQLLRCVASMGGTVERHPTVFAGRAFEGEVPGGGPGDADMMIFLWRVSRGSVVRDFSFFGVPVLGRWRLRVSRSSVAS